MGGSQAVAPVFRSRPALGLLVAAVLAPAPVVIAHDQFATDRKPLAAPSPVRYEPREAPFAGRPAGEGRDRPGRSPEAADPTAMPATKGAPAPAALPAGDHGPAAGDRETAPPSGAPGGDSGDGDAGADAGEGGEADDGAVLTTARPVGPAVRILPLGTGFALVGIGLGLLGLRARRG